MKQDKQKFILIHSSSVEDRMIPIPIIYNNSFKAGCQYLTIDDYPLTTSKGLLWELCISKH